MTFYFYINFTYKVEMDYMIIILNDNAFDFSNNCYKMNAHKHSLLYYFDNLHILYKNHLIILHLVYFYFTFNLYNEV
jgi:hypothetical protein